MGCSGCSSSTLPVINRIPFQQHRRRICDACEHAVNGLCQIVETKHPGKADIDHGAERPELKCPIDKWTEAPVTCPRCERPRQIISLGRSQCEWCDRKYNHQSQAKPVSRRPISGTNTFVGTGGFRPMGKPVWISMEQYSRDVKTLASMLPDDLTCVIGIARSGMKAATEISMLLHLPLLALRQNKRDIIQVGNGWRLGGVDHIEPKPGKAVLVDDTVMLGNSFRSVTEIAKSQFPDLIRAAVYVNPRARTQPEYLVWHVGAPHLLEWNIFNSVHSTHIALDFDGILCEDCPPGDDDDGPRYLNFIRNAKPKYLPRKHPVPLIVTARVEKYRVETEAWLDRWKVKHYALIMHPAATTREREKHDIAAFKAEHYKYWAQRFHAVPGPHIFIESEDWQASRIHELTGFMTACPATSAVYCRGINYDLPGS